MLEDLLADNWAQPKRLLDLYLAGDFPKEILVERKSWLEKTMEALERERAGLTARLEAQTLTGEQIRSLKHFVAEVAEGLVHADEDFETRWMCGRLWRPRVGGRLSMCALSWGIVFCRL